MIGAGVFDRSSPPCLRPRDSRKTLSPWGKASPYLHSGGLSRVCSWRSEMSTNTHCCWRGPRTRRLAARRNLTGCC